MRIQYFLPLCAVLLLASVPDEGQWLPQQIRQMDWAKLRDRGMVLSKDEFWHPEKGGVLTAAVQINGCTASFVTDKGLMITNHHCGFGAVSALSSVEHNYLRDGYTAKTRKEEMPAPGVSAFIVRKIEDVTAAVKAAQDKAKTDTDRARITSQVIKQLVAKGEKQPNTKCHVASFFEGREYHMYYRTQLKDIRLCYAPPRAVGEFGGDVDNWEWPRHTGDFCFFRAYVAPDGSPRGHHEDNVPFKPEHYLRVSREGVQEDDLVVIMGYPGRTERYLTSEAVKDREGFYYPKRLDILTRIIDVMREVSKRDAATELRYVSGIKSLANVEKNAAGMVWGLARNGVVARKMKEEAEFTSWVDGDKGRQEKFGAILRQLKDMDIVARQTQEKDLILSLATSPRITPFLRGLVDLVNTARRLPGGDVPAALAKRFSNPALMRDFEDVQKPIMKILLDEARNLPEEQQLAGSEVLEPHTDTTIEVVLQGIVRASAMHDPKAWLELLAGGRKAVAESQDPLVILARGLLEEAIARGARQTEVQGRNIVVGQQWIDAQQQWRGATFYPDANSTMRASIATVKSYKPRDGVKNTPHTTVAGILRKETGKAPFASPKALIAAAEKRKESHFYDWRIGDVPVCFLADGDTTGGNSGSPVINGRGEFVGINFDRVYENVSGDYGWNAKRSRNISVDVRYILWIMEQVQPAHHLLREMRVLD